MSTIGCSDASVAPQREVWHQRKVERHAAFVAIAEVGPHVGRPLVGLGKQKAIGIFRIDHSPHFADGDMRLRQVLARRAVPLQQIRNCIQAQTVHAAVQPEPHRIEHRVENRRVIVVQIRLVGEEAVPVICIRHRIPRPVRGLRITEDDADVRKLVIPVAPNIEIAFRRSRRCLPGGRVGNHGCWSRRMVSSPIQ